MTVKFYSKKLAWYILLVGILFFCIDYFFRISPSLIIPQLMQQYKINAFGIGALSAAFYIGYTVMQIPMGALLDSVDFRKILLISIITCALAYVLFIVSQQFYVGLLARFFIGVSSASSFIGALFFTAKYLPIRYFSFISGITIALGTLSASGVQLICAFFFKFYAWHLVLIAAAFVALLLGLFLIPIFSKKLHPNTHQFVSKKEYFIGIKKVLTNRIVWLNGINGGLFYLPTTILGGLWGKMINNERK